MAPTVCLCGVYREAVIWPVRVILHSISQIIDTGVTLRENERTVINTCFCGGFELSEASQPLITVRVPRVDGGDWGRPRGKTCISMLKIPKLSYAARHRALPLARHGNGSSTFNFGISRVVVDVGSAPARHELN